MHEIRPGVTNLLFVEGADEEALVTWCQPGGIPPNLQVVNAKG